MFADYPVPICRGETPATSLRLRLVLNTIEEVECLLRRRDLERPSRTSVLQVLDEAQEVLQQVQEDRIPVGV
jgi:hypothetical protein